MARTEHYKPGEIFIVKVQRSLATTHEEPRFLIYDEHQIIWDDFPQSELPELVEAMGDEVKQFYHADITEEGLLNIDTETPTPWQEW